MTTQEIRACRRKLRHILATAFLKLWEVAEINRRLAVLDAASLWRAALDLNLLPLEEGRRPA